MPRHPPCALDNLTNTHIKKSRHKCAQKQKMLASTVQFSTTTRTEAAPHPQAKPAPTVPRDNTPRTAVRGLSSQDPTVCRQPHHPTAGTGLSGVSTSSRATPSHPHTGPTGPARGGTGAPHPHHHGAQNIRLRTPPGEVFGEAP